MFFQQLVWTTTRMTFGWWLRLRYRCGLDKRSDPLPKGPFILVANHAHFFDPFLIGALTPRAMHIMMSEDGFRINPFGRWFMKTVGVFPKKKGARDIQAMKRTLNILRSGDPVLIFPEGQISWDGETQLIYGGIERLAKRSKVPLVMVRFQGNFLSGPWWAKGKRKGRILVHRKVLSAEQLAEMPPPDILQSIKDNIYSNDTLDEANLRAPFSGNRLAEGLERLVWWCMHCDAEDTLTTSGDEITCQHCGSVWRIDAYCALKGVDPMQKIDTLHGWVQSHKARIKRKIQDSSKGGQLTNNTHVSLYRANPERDFFWLSQGTLSLTPAELAYVADDGDFQLTVPIENLSNYVVQKRDVFEFEFDGTTYQAAFEEKSPMKWLMYLSYLLGYEDAERRGYL